MNYRAIKMKLNVFLTATSFLAFFLAVLYAIYHHQNKVDLPNRNPRNTEWLDFRTDLLRQPGIVRYYDFEDERRFFGEFRNRGIQWLGDMRAADTQTPSEPSFKIREGRFEGTRAVQTDYYPIEARSYVTSEKGFTVAAWIKHEGPGSVIGGNCPNAGTLLALGDGVWSGWKFVLLHPSNVLLFELGRPKPQSSVGTFSVTRIPPKTWTHIAATWDRKHINLYVNGLLCGRVEYSGPYYEVKSYNKLRVGYVGNGLGSIIVTCDELLIADHALSAAEILSIATEGEKIPAECNGLLTDSAERFIHKEWQEAKTKLESAHHALSCYPKAYGTLLFRLAEVELAIKNAEQAQKNFGVVANFGYLPQNIRAFSKFAEIFVANHPTDSTLNIFPLLQDNAPIQYENHCDSSPVYENTVVEYDFLLPIK
jgi:hypothetical protein